jgi:beta-glucosidase
MFHRKAKRFISILGSFLFLLVSYAGASGWTAQDLSEQSRIEAQADSILDLLTIEEKIALLHGNSKFSSTGIPRLSFPELESADGPTGVREELERDSWEPLNLITDSATFFPAGPALAATWNRDLSFRYGEALGEETRARDKDILLGPSVNIIRTPLSGRNFEFFTEDPYLNAEIAVAYIQGLQSKDAAACIKHYIANNQEWMRWRIDVQMDERALREIYLPVYKAAVQKAGVLAFMGAYNKVRGWYCCENDYLLNKILKEEWRFKGVVMSDWGATHSTINAAFNGLDIEMGTHKKYHEYYFSDPLLEAVKNGQVGESVIDEKVRRILYVMLNCKIKDENRCRGSISTPKHFRTAYDVASEGIVLLKNSKGVLPLNRSVIKRLAVMGENAMHCHAKEGFGAGVKTKKEITPLRGLKNKLCGEVEIQYAPGYENKFNLIDIGRKWKIRVPDTTANVRLIREAVELAKTCDAVILFGGSNRSIESEGFDRKNMSLPFGQVELIKAVAKVNPNTVVVMIASAPYDLTEIEPDISTLVWGWFNGSEAGTAMADALFGDVNPSGKLPFTMPVKLEDSPAHVLNTYPGEDSTTVVYKEGILVGYRWFDTKAIEPLYPFGYGLSYTCFDHSSLQTNQKFYGVNDTVRLSLAVRNIGDRPGAETIQIYMHDIEASVFRPAKELKGFEKVFLQPEEEKTIRIDLPVQDLAFFDDQAMTWIVEPGQFELMAGASSRDIRGSVFVEVQ